MKLDREKRNRLIAGGLVLVLGSVIYYQFFAPDATSPATTPRPTGSPAVTGATAGTPATTATAPVAKPKVELAVITDPLPLSLLSGRGNPDASSGRNIFVFPTPTPVPTPKPPPPTPTPVPPPITITSVNPQGRIARTKEFEMTVMGTNIPPDARVLINGTAYPTAFLNAAQVKATIGAVAIIASGNLRVEVKSISNPALYSNPLNLNVADPPLPPFVYVALIVDKNGVHTAILKSQGDGRLINVHKGDSVDKWKIVGISGQKLDVLDTEYNIPHVLGFTGEGG
jgi:hypothetical protein